MRLLLITILLLALCVCAGAETFVISQGNRAKTAIVISKYATAPMRTGAEEIQKHIEMIAGAVLPIIEVTSTALPNIPANYDGYILISNSEADPNLQEIIKFESEEYSIRTVPGKPFQIRISGDGKRGAIYGCYAFLEDVLGFRWFTPTITKVPEGSTVKVKDLWIREKPAFEYREPFFYEAFEKFWAVRNKTNGNTQRLDASVGDKIRYGRFVHTFDQLVPQSYFAEHPEYFSLIAGQRMEGYAQLCLTNPDVLRISIARVREWLENDRTSLIFSVSQNDTRYPCECNKCQAVVEEEGSESGPILRFVNAIAEDIAKDYPDVLIDTLAYGYSEAPPKHVKPVKNVRIRMAPIGNCVGHPMDKCPRNKEPYENLRNWAKITDQLYIWHYSTNFSNYMMPLPCIDDIVTSVPIYKKNGCVGMFYQGSYQSNGGALAEMKAYLLAKLMWDPTIDAKAVIKDYMNGVYGKSAGVMTEWVNLLHSEVRKSLKNHAFIYDSTNNPYMTDRVIKKSYELLDKAARLSADDPQTLKEIRKARMWIDYVALSGLNVSYKIEGDRYKSFGDSVDEGVRTDLAKAISEFGVTHAREGSANVEEFLASLDQRKEYEVRTLENDRLRLQLVPELGGRIVELTPKKSNLNTFTTPMDIRTLAASGYEEYMSHDYRGPGCTDEFEVDTAKSGPGTLVMTLDSLKSLSVTREVKLEDNRISISTTMTNTGSATYSAKMRVHPEFIIPEGAKPTATFTALDGEKKTVVFKDVEENLFFSGANMPNGKWSVDVGKYVITQVFDTDNVGMALLNSTLNKMRFNLELYSKTTELAPGESFTFTNGFIIDEK